MAIHRTALAVTTVLAASACSSGPTSPGPDGPRIHPSFAVLESLGDSVHLELRPSGEGTNYTDVRWKSLNNDVITVTGNGKVIAKAFGVALVVASVSNGAADTATIQVGSSAAGLPAFPDAAGHGAVALSSCDRTDVEVRFVSRLDDSGPGTLRHAIEGSDPTRLSVVVFRTGGTITLRSPIDFGRSCMYIAGQTAPGGGIQLRREPGDGGAVLGMKSGHDIAVRYLRVRSGRGEPGKGDNISIAGGHDIIIDHASLAWSNDEQLGIHGIEGGPRVYNVTVQNSILAQALRQHSTGSLIGFEPGRQAEVRDLTFYRNLFAHNAHRNPRVESARGVEVVNNIVYNWYSRIGRTVHAAEVDFVGNYFKRGPWSSRRLLEHEYREDPVAVDPSVFLAGNIAAPDFMDPDADNRELIRYNQNGPDGGHGPLPASAFRSSPLGAAAVPALASSARGLLDRLLPDVGAAARVSCDGSWAGSRDRADENVIGDVRNGTGPDADEEIDHESDFGGHPTLSRGQACADSDEDGMPDAFEERYGLDPNRARDRSLDPDGDGYTNLEEYVNGSRPA